MYISFHNNTNSILKKIAKRSLKAKKNSIIILAIMLSTILFTSLFTISFSLMAAMRDSNMKRIGTSAHGGVKHITIDEFMSIKSNSDIKKCGCSVVIGTAEGHSFTKLPTEVRWADRNYANLTFCNPTIGTLPQKKQEFATSKLVLDALGVSYKLGQTIKLTILTDKGEITKSFILSGIWDGNPISYRQTLYISKSLRDEIIQIAHGTSTSETTNSSGYVDCVYNFRSSWNLDKKTKSVLEDINLYKRASVNTAYLTATIHASNVIFILIAIIIIIIAGYLLIYNVFYISIAQDITFYGELKTLGTTTNQIKKIVYYKAIKLSLLGIPLGLLIGWPIGRLILPSIVNILTENMRTITTFNPLIFIISIILTLITIFISCHKPAKIASKVSPIEALRYIEVSNHKKHKKSKRITCYSLAMYNLGRSKKKLILVTLSFTLSIVLLNSVFTYVSCFDFDKFVRDISITDFSVADSTIINNNSPFNTSAISTDFIEQASKLDGLEHIGNIYNVAIDHPLEQSSINHLMELSKKNPSLNDMCMNYKVRGSHGVNLYGLDPFPAQQLEVVEGELNNKEWEAGRGIYVSRLSMLGQGNQNLYSPGDSATVYFNKKNKKQYRVLAIVNIPPAYVSPLSLDLGFEIILPSKELLSHLTEASYAPMRTVFDVKDSEIDRTEQWLKNYTTNTDSTLDYWSKNSLRSTYNGMIAMYYIVGGSLCTILALIGILNFINSIVTSIISRYKEFAMLQSVGMTNKQLKKMLTMEGLGYLFFSILAALTLSSIANFTIVRSLGADLTYFTWHFTLLPVLLCILPLIMITILVPVCCYKKVAKKSVIERLFDKE